MCLRPVPAGDSSAARPTSRSLATRATDGVPAPQVDDRLRTRPRSRSSRRSRIARTGLADRPASGTTSSPPITLPLPEALGSRLTSFTGESNSAAENYVEEISGLHHDRHVADPRSLFAAFEPVSVRHRWQRDLDMHAVANTIFNAVPRWRLLLRVRVLRQRTVGDTAFDLPMAFGTVQVELLLPARSVQLGSAAAALHHAGWRCKYGAHLSSCSARGPLCLGRACALVEQLFEEALALLVVGLVITLRLPAIVRLPP